MSKPGKRYAKWIKPDTEEQMLYASTSTGNMVKHGLRDKKWNSSYQGLWEEAMGSRCLMGMEFLFGVTKESGKGCRTLWMELVPPNDTLTDG